MIIMLLQRNIIIICFVIGTIYPFYFDCKRLM
jgi:hypothetical protein